MHCEKPSPFQGEGRVRVEPHANVMYVRVVFHSCFSLVAFDKKNYVIPSVCMGSVFSVKSIRSEKTLLTLSF